MKKNVVVMTIVGMMLLSSFMIMPVLADEATSVQMYGELPENDSVDVDITQATVNVTIIDTKYSTFNWSIETSPDVGSNSSNDDSNGSKSVDLITPLPYNTKITWYVNVSNGDGWKNVTYIFTTRSRSDIVYVDDNYDETTPGWQIDHFDKIQDGIDEVAEDGTVEVKNGTYYEHLVITKTISLTGEDKTNTTIDSEKYDDAIDISADYVNINGFTIKNGSSGFGIKLIDSSNNTIVDNIILDSDVYGIYIDDLSNDSIIYHNNFIGNAENANDTGNNNIWYNAELKEGNYWDDYTGEDKDGDRIGDTPYNISGKQPPSQDIYPLMFPFGEIPPVADFTYNVDGTTVTFDASSSYDRDGNIVSYYWEFGDGENSTETNPEHTYAEECETYKVTLDIAENTGLHNETSKDVTTNDTTKPTLEIVKPERALYIKNQKIRSLLFRTALIIGDITIEVNASDEGSEIEKVEFYAGLFGTKYLGNDTTAEPSSHSLTGSYYSFNWTRDRFRLFHIQILTVKAYDKAGNVAVKRMIVRKLL